MQRFLDTMPKGGFKFVYTTKHGSWLNMIASFYSKMTRQMLRGLCVESKQEMDEIKEDEAASVLYGNYLIFDVYELSFNAKDLLCLWIKSRIS